MTNINPPGSMERIEQLTRDAVREVFLSMLSLEMTTTAPDPLPPDPEGQIVGSVGFIGQATGVICLYAGVGFARVISSRMLGLEPAEVDCGDMLNDVVGELSNMVVGYVKSRLCDAGMSCTMTIPSIVRGQQLSIERPSHTSRSILAFRSGEQRLFAEILLKPHQS